MSDEHDQAEEFPAEPVAVEAVAAQVYRARAAVEVPQSLRQKLQERVRLRLKLAQIGQGELL